MEEEIVQEGSGFVIRDNGATIAEITFVPEGEGTLVLDHTYVDPAYRGRQLAERLVKRVVNYARESNKVIVPACSYAHAQFRRHKEYHDVWRKEN